MPHRNFDHKNHKQLYLLYYLLFICIALILAILIWYYSEIQIAKIRYGEAHLPDVRNYSPNNFNLFIEIESQTKYIQNEKKSI